MPVNDGAMCDLLKEKIFNFRLEAIAGVNHLPADDSHTILTTGSISSKKKQY